MYSSTYVSKGLFLLSSSQIVKIVRSSFSGSAAGSHEAVDREEMKREDIRERDKWQRQRQINVRKEE